MYDAGFDALTGPAVPAQRGVRDAARGEVLMRHARLASSGKPVFCTPSRAEIDGLIAPRAGRGTDGKVIYPTREAAEAAARELEALGSRCLRPYRCGRSWRGHIHLTTDSAPHGSAAAPVRPATARVRLRRAHTHRAGLAHIAGRVCEPPTVCVTAGLAHTAPAPRTPRPAPRTPRPRRAHRARAA